MKKRQKLTLFHKIDEFSLANDGIQIAIANSVSINFIFVYGLGIIASAVSQLSRLDFF